MCAIYDQAHNCQMLRTQLLRLLVDTGRALKYGAIHCRNPVVSMCALVKKLSWRVRKSCGWSSRSQSYSFADDLSYFVSPAQQQNVHVSLLTEADTPCATKLLDAGYPFGEHVPAVSNLCSTCGARKAAVALAPDQPTVLMRERTFCRLCQTAVKAAT